MYIYNMKEIKGEKMSENDNNNKIQNSIVCLPIQILYIIIMSNIMQ